MTDTLVADRSSLRARVAAGADRLAWYAFAILIVASPMAGRVNLRNRPIELVPPTYTDLLLHDLGEELADDRPDFDADGREWRTPPLWGIGLTSLVNGHTLFLHDGRARSFAEAILWHGGEAETSREKFRTIAKEDRRALIRFLESL